MQTAKLQNQKGFTLVEIAIVLVIIGLLLGGVLKGQEMINAAKIKNDTDSLKALQASIYAYKDRAGFYPGTVRATNPTSNVLNGSQIVNIASSADTAFDITTDTSLIAGAGSENVFADLTSEGFLKSPNLSPEVDDAGGFMIGYGEDGLTASVPALTNPFATAPTNIEANKNYVCINYTTAIDNAESIVVGMDVKMDDGVATTGVIRTASDAANGNGGAIVCLEI